MDHVTFHHYRYTQRARPILNTYERLRQEGTSFTSCKSVHPLCLPARASMLTGMYSHNHGKINNDVKGDPHMPLVCEILRDAGFDLGYFGKNYSGIETERFCFEGFYPNGYGNPYLTGEYHNYLRDIHLEDPLFYQELGQGNQYVGTSDNRAFNLAKEDCFNRYCSGYLGTPGEVHKVDFLADAALEWLDKRNSSRPFVLRVDTWGPHHAYQVPLVYRDLIDPKDIMEYPSFGHVYGDEKPRFASEFLQDLQRHGTLNGWKDWQAIMARAYEQYSYIDAVLGKLIDGVRKRAQDTYIFTYC